MGFVQGEGRMQGTLFAVCLQELIPHDHVCRVIDAFVDRLDMAGLGFERAEAAETGRPGYDPRELWKLYLYGYLQQIRSSRRLESECRRNSPYGPTDNRHITGRGRRSRPAQSHNATRFT
jgi:transposase